jgi:formylglycine-generating enzyme required for sulfatase activity
MRATRICCLLIIAGLFSGILSTGCLGNRPLLAGLACRNDQDCKGPDASLFCNKDNICEAQECTSGDTRVCFTGTTGCDTSKNECKGICKTGNQTCTNNVWGPCQGQVLPQAEDCKNNPTLCCDNLDNDCDGTIDGNFPQNQICEVTSIKLTSGAGGLSVCNKGKESCETTDQMTYIQSSGVSSFLLGTPRKDPDHKSVSEPDESINDNQFSTSFSYNFAMGQHEVTQKQFKDIMGYSPKDNGASDTLPVTNVSWHEAAMYTVLLSQKRGLTPCFNCGSFDPASGQPFTNTCIAAEGLNTESAYVNRCNGFRLPTETEWELAYRAQIGDSIYTDFHNGNMEQAKKEDYKDNRLDKIGFYKQNSGGKPNPIMKKSPNAWGLHDMSGNVAEWVFDWYKSSYSGNSTDRIGPLKSESTKERVFRGGHFDSFPHQCRGSKREKADPATKQPTVGFRIARTLVTNTQ